MQANEKVDNYGDKTVNVDQYNCYEQIDVF